MRDTKGGKQFRTSKIVSCEWKTILRGRKEKKNVRNQPEKCFQENVLKTRETNKKKIPGFLKLCFKCESE